VTAPPQPEGIGVDASTIVGHLTRIIASAFEQLAVARALLDQANAELDAQRQARIAENTHDEYGA
jgi:hypothetical protein